MPELNELPTVAPADVSDDDLLLLFDNSAVSSKSRQVTRADLLKDVPRVGGDADFNESEFASLTATLATVIDLTVTTSLVFDAAATLEKMYNVTSVLTPGVIASNGEQTITTTLTGALVTDYLSMSFTSVLPEGLVTQAWISAADTVSIRFDNVSPGSIASASYTAKLVAMRFT